MWSRRIFSITLSLTLVLSLTLDVFHLFIPQSGRQPANHLSAKLQKNRQVLRRRSLPSSCTFLVSSPLTVLQQARHTIVSKAVSESSRSMPNSSKLRSEPTSPHRLLPMTARPRHHPFSATPARELPRSLAASEAPSPTAPLRPKRTRCSTDAWAKTTPRAGQPRPLQQPVKMAAKPPRCSVWTVPPRSTAAM